LAESEVLFDNNAKFKVIDVVRETRMVGTKRYFVDIINLEEL